MPTPKPASVKTFKDYRKCALCGVIFPGNSALSVGLYCSQRCKMDSFVFGIRKFVIPKKYFYKIQQEAWEYCESREDVVRRILIGYYKDKIAEEKILALEKQVKQLDASLRIVNARTLSPAPRPQKVPAPQHVSEVAPQTEEKEATEEEMKSHRLSDEEGSKLCG